MPKVTLNDIASGYSLKEAYNTNNDTIEAAFDNTLSRDGSAPNQMEADIDLNSNSLLNVNEINGILWEDVLGQEGSFSTFTAQRFSGDGSTTAFVLSFEPQNKTNTQIYVDGVYQSKATYSLLGSTITFSEAPPVGTDNIEVVSIATAPLGTTTSNQVTYTSEGGSETTVEAKLRALEVEDYTALVAIDNPYTGMTAIVTDDGIGGTFVYDATQVATNNGGTIINGWVRQFSGPVHVTWFGADPNATEATTNAGTAVDSTAAFNLATRAAYVSTGNFDLSFPQGVYVPPGSYWITGQVWIHKGQHLFGAGEGASRILLNTTTDNTAPIFMLGYNSVNETTLSDGGGLPPEISNLWTFGGPAAHAVVFTGVAGAKIHDLFMTFPGVGIHVIGTDTRVTNIQLDGGLTGIRVGGHTHVFANILIFNMNFGVITLNGAGGGCSELVFTNVHFNFMKFVGVQFTTGVTHANITFGDCNFVLNTQYATFTGFVLTQCSSAKALVFNNCQFSNMFNFAYRHQTGVDNELHFNDCLFTGTKVTADYVQSTTAAVARISSNRVWSNDCHFDGLHATPFFVDGTIAETRVFINGGTFINSAVTSLVGFGVGVPTNGSSVLVQGLQFERLNIPVVLEAGITTPGWRVGSDRAIPITGQGGTPSNVQILGSDSAYFVDTTADVATVFLPRSDSAFKPTQGDRLTFIDAKGTWQTNAVTFQRGDNTINGAASDYVANLQHGRAEFIFEEDGWRATGGSKPDVAAEILTAARTITAGESGKAFYLNAAGGFTVTLPAPALGLRYSFHVYTAPTTSYIVRTNGGSNLMAGNYLDIVGELEGFTGQNTVTFVGGTSLYTDRLELQSDGVGWHCQLFSRANGGMLISVT